MAVVKVCQQFIHSAMLRVTIYRWQTTKHTQTQTRHYTN